MVAPGVVAGTVPRLGIADNVEYVRISDRKPIAWRVGFGGVVGVPGGSTLVGPHAAAMFIVRDRGSRYAGHEKMGGGGTDRSVFAFGIESRVGLSSRDLEGDENTVGAGVSAALTAEWISLSTWKCC